MNWPIPGCTRRAARARTSWDDCNSNCVANSKPPKRSCWRFTNRMRPELVRPGRVSSELRFAADAARGYLPRMPALLRHAACAAILVALSACATTPSAPGKAPSTETNAVQATPAHAFFAGLSALCGKAYAGRVVVDTPTPANDPFAGKPLVMHVRECSAACHPHPVPCRRRSFPHLGCDAHGICAAPEARPPPPGWQRRRGDAVRRRHRRCRHRAAAGISGRRCVEGDVSAGKDLLSRSTTPGPSIGAWPQLHLRAVAPERAAVPRGIRPDQHGCRPTSAMGRRETIPSANGGGLGWQPDPMRRMIGSIECDASAAFDAIHPATISNPLTPIPTFIRCAGEGARQLGSGAPREGADP